MIYSLYQVDFISGGLTQRLVSVGDVLDADIAPKVSQSATRYAAIGAEFAEHEAEGGAVTTVDFGVIRKHANHTALRSFCFLSAASLPSGREGSLRVAIAGGDVWEISDAVLLSKAPVPRVPCKTFETLTAYSVVGGTLSPLNPIAIYPGIPWQWILQPWDDLTTDWDTF